jgi:polyphosphate kinase 2 (PPK2 family)
MKKVCTRKRHQEYIDLQVEMIAMQRCSGNRPKSSNTAEKGGAIMPFVCYLNPRGYRIVALPKPTKVERGQWYFQRYINELQNKVEIVFFQ